MATFRVLAKPRSNADSIVGMRSGLLSVSVTAPAEGGKANTALCKTIAKAFGVPKSTISVIRGDSARIKTVNCATLDEDQLALALEKYREFDT